MKSALRGAFVGIWLCIVAVCIAMAFLMQGLYRLGVDARVDTVAARVDKAASALQQRFGLYATSYAARPDFTDAQRRRELGLILQIVLGDYEDVEGGFYAPTTGFIAYAFPSYEGNGSKQDVPEAEATRIAEVAQAALAAGQPTTRRFPGARQTLILTSLPAGNDSGLAIWVMARAHARSEDGTTRLLAGLALLGFFIVGSGIVLLLTLRRWNRAVLHLGTEIAKAETGRPWTLGPSGHRDIDRVAAMVASLHARLDREQQASQRLESELARAQRIASLGRMAAQLVHEIRNPIAAMRLRAENALAGVGPGDAALTHILADIHRLDDLLERLQAMTRLNALQVEAVDLRDWLDGCVAPLEPRLAERGVTLARVAPAATWPFDPKQLCRALENLLINAVQHVARDSGRIAITIAVVPAVACSITVVDNGPGIADDVIGHVFDPFHTTRADGTGLGLAIAREIVEAHGGSLRAMPSTAPTSPTRGATFLMELPWRAS